MRQGIRTYFSVVCCHLLVCLKPNFSTIFELRLPFVAVLKNTLGFGPIIWRGIFIEIYMEHLKGRRRRSRSKYLICRAERSSGVFKEKLRNQIRWRLAAIIIKV